MYREIVKKTVESIINNCTMKQLEKTKETLDHLRFIITKETCLKEPLCVFCELQTFCNIVMVIDRLINDRKVQNQQENHTQ